MVNIIIQVGVKERMRKMQMQADWVIVVSSIFDFMQISTMLIYGQAIKNEIPIISFLMRATIYVSE